MSRYSKAALVGTALVLVFGLGVTAAKKRFDPMLVVEASVENFRDEPNGTKLGTLLQGTQIEQIGEEGQWVRFRIEGWVWGPSLDGFEEEEEEEERRGSAAEPISPLSDELPRIKELVNDKDGIFYGVNLDEDLGLLQLRFRVRDIDRDVLERRMLAVQGGVMDLLAGVVEFSLMRVETNRPDGSGEVGLYIAETSVADLDDYGDDFASWRTHTRFSTDGGETWEEAE
jgi:hypothetical protein